MKVRRSAGMARVGCRGVQRSWRNQGEVISWSNERKTSCQFKGVVTDPGLGRSQRYPVESNPHREQYRARFSAERVETAVRWWTICRTACKKDARRRREQSTSMAYQSGRDTQSNK